jgi:hypothetical protein
MAVLVTLLAVVLALMALLVAGLLRSHAEILRALHDLGVDLDPAHSVGGSPIGAPTVRSRSVPARPARAAVDVGGETPEHDAVSIAVDGAKHLTLLAFLTSTCSTCLGFWDAFAADAPAVPGDARLVVVTKGTDAESPASVRKLSPGISVPIVMSSAAWTDYDVPVAPFFVLVDGPSGDVLGEGAASTWEQVTSMLQQALSDAGIVGDTAHGARTRTSVKYRRDADREERVDFDLLAAGIRPGDPSLYPQRSEDVDPHRPASS